MIQRIQSVYLLVVTILIIICLCSPVGSYIGSDYSVSALTNLCLTMADGTKDYAPWALFVILLVVAFLFPEEPCPIFSSNIIPHTKYLLCRSILILQPARY